MKFPSKTFSEAWPTWNSEADIRRTVDRLNKVSERLLSSVDGDIDVALCCIVGRRSSTDLARVLGARVRRSRPRRCANRHIWSHVQHSVVGQFRIYKSGWPRAVFSSRGLSPQKYWNDDRGTYLITAIKSSTPCILKTKNILYDWKKNIKF